jgi:membrane protease YdiL (CAAX protease family)
MGQFNPLRRFPLTSFFALAYAWTWVCWWSVYAAARGYWQPPFPGEWLATLGQFGPFAAALAVAFVSGGSQAVRELLGRLTRWRVRPIWLGVSLLLLPLTMIAAIVLFSAWNGTLAALQFRESWQTLPAHFIYLLLLGGPLGEEPGWRGFALPRLQVRLGRVQASVWLGLLWAGWHLPLWWHFPPPCPYWMYVAGAVIVSFLFTWLFNHTGGSVLYGLLFHTSLSIASVRLPDVPAYSWWLACLLLIVALILLCDGTARLPAESSQPVEAETAVA